ncbi:hypothetical protein Poly24_52360 [Rosistilla carotiformis]|uniref:Uncharacterized protein n=1 Tax=Rosistilla carotiformis TaxID=2528017 RepID=A0A518K134_9BACT|nr:hypothetical protein [Rosistilla carotiformis]QDV71499.1 hypothetical protein Poly24_52360 [Rosistilla carotiformis]
MLTNLNITRRFHSGDTNWRSPAVTVAVIYVALTVGTILGACRADADDEAAISRLPAGSLVSANGLEGWSDLVLVATPDVTGGEVSGVSQVVLRYAEMFTTVIAADVHQVQGEHRLQRVGIGMAVADGENFRIVSDQDGAAGLGMIGAQVLQAAEQSLDHLTVALRLATAIVIDSPALVAVDKRHEKVVARHLIWVQPKSGLVSSAVWFIRGGEPAEVVDGQGMFLPENFRETRHLHVDVGEFFLGIPGPKAFAMQGLPRGKPFPLAAPHAAAACATPLTIDDFRALAQYLSEAARHQ